MISDKPLILTFSDYYLPGYKGGGCIRGVANLVSYLGDEFEFKIVTRDRDSRESQAYPDIVIGYWQTIGKAKVLYLDPPSLSLRVMLKIIITEKPSVIYLNSFFSPLFTGYILLLRELGLIPKISTILAPRGEFSQGALALKNLKKRLYLALFKLMVSPKKIIFQASTIHEKCDIQRKLPFWSVFVAADLPNPINNIESHLKLPQKIQKQPGNLNILFLSRISRMKNLDGLLKMLDQLEGTVQLNIYGHIDDPVYWDECQSLIKILPDNIKVQYWGAIPHHAVETVMKEHHLFFLPTLGENFGYVILEALVAGCPVLISDKTSWRSLEEKGVGWDISLEKQELFKKVLQQCINMDEITYHQLSEQSRKYGMEWVQNNTALEENRTLFKSAVLS